MKVLIAIGDRVIQTDTEQFGALIKAAQAFKRMEPVMKRIAMVLLEIEEAKKGETK